MSRNIDGLSKAHDRLVTRTRWAHEQQQEAEGAAAEAVDSLVTAKAAEEEALIARYTEAAGRAEVFAHLAAELSRRRDAAQVAVAQARVDEARVEAGELGAALRAEQAVKGEAERAVTRCRNRRGEFAGLDDDARTARLVELRTALAEAEARVEVARRAHHEAAQNVQALLGDLEVLQGATPETGPQNYQRQDRIRAALDRIA